MKKVIIGLIIVALAVFGVYKYVYQSHRDIKTESASFTIEAKTVLQEFASNQESATTKYLNKTIEVSGLITEIEGNSVVLDESVFSSFIEGTDMSGVINGANLRIKGRCIGYDELLEQVKLDQSSIVE